MEPHKSPDVLRKSVVIRVYVDAYHSLIMLNGRSNTSIIIYVNNTQTIWFTKQQNTVEFSSFGLEFIALMITTEMFINAGRIEAVSISSSYYDALHSILNFDATIIYM